MAPLSGRRRSEPWYAETREDLFVLEEDAYAYLTMAMATGLKVDVAWLQLQHNDTLGADQPVPRQMLGANVVGFFPEAGRVVIADPDTEVIALSLGVLTYLGFPL